MQIFGRGTSCAYFTQLPCFSPFRPSFPVSLHRLQSLPRPAPPAKISQPQVQLPSLLDEEDEEEYEEDPDAIPPPLDDEDGLAPMVLDGEGKRKGKA